MASLHMVSARKLLFLSIGFIATLIAGPIVTSAFVEWSKGLHQLWSNCLLGGRRFQSCSGHVKSKAYDDLGVTSHSDAGPRPDYPADHRERAPRHFAAASGLRDPA